MRMYWKHVMLTELLFLVEASERGERRVVVGMVQWNVPNWQAFAIYPAPKGPEHRPLGFFTTKELAMQAAESDARREHRELGGMSAGDTPTEAMDQRVPELAEAVSA